MADSQNSLVNIKKREDGNKITRSKFSNTSSALGTFGQRPLEIGRAYNEESTSL